MVELLVAMVFTSILMVGMTGVFSAQVSGFSSTLESTAIQRNARWALQLLQDDVFQAGFLLPPRIVTQLQGTTQPPLKIETLATAVTYTKPDGSTESIGKPDELQVVMDQPLNVQATLGAAAATGATEITVRFASGGNLVNVGDLVMVKDSAWEIYRVNSAPDSAGKVAISGDTALQDAYGNDTGNTMVVPQVLQAHQTGTELLFVRPLRVVSYTLQALNLDPANTAATVPCLVRRTAAIGGAFGTPEILIEGATQLHLDWSLDGGQTWIRKANNLVGSQWADISNATSTAFNALATKSALAATLPGGMSSSKDPFWFNYASVVLKIDVETRTQLKRAEYSATANQAQFRTRRETLLVSPRNFALGAP